MPLSDDDLAFVRSMLPTTSTSNPEHVTDVQLNYIYANQAGSDVDKTIAYALRQMCIKLSHKVGRTNTATGDTIQAQQHREAVCAAAKEWANMTGIGGGAIIRIGLFDEGIDQEEEP